MCRGSGCYGLFHRIRTDQAGFNHAGRQEYVLAVRTDGDIFGELCLSGELARAETAIAMNDTRLHADAL